MKKVILGAVMLFSGMMADAWLLVGAMEKDLIVNGQQTAFAILSFYRLMPAFYVFAGVAVLGFALALIGVLDKKDSCNMEEKQ